MPGAFAPRFAIETGFLILLGVGAGYADLRPAVIVALLAGGWILVSLIELAVWRSQARPIPAHVPPPIQDVVEEEPEPTAEAVTPEPEDDHQVLPCGAKVFVTFRGKTVLTTVVDRGPFSPRFDFEVTPALAELVGLTGVQTIRWSFARAG